MQLVQVAPGGVGVWRSMQLSAHSTVAICGQSRPVGQLCSDFEWFETI